MPAEPIKLKPQVRIKPIVQGKCKIEIDAVVDWGTAMEIMRALGYVGEIATTEVRTH